MFQRKLLKVSAHSRLTMSVAKKHHGDYRVWVVGHIEAYMLRINKKFTERINEINKKIIEEFKHPVVG